MLTVQRCSEARQAGRVRDWQVQCREPKTGQQQGSTVKKHFAYLGISICSYDVQLLQSTGCILRFFQRSVRSSLAALIWFNECFVRS